MGKLDNRIAAITGSSSGIGAATARLFAAEGAKVIVADIDEEGGRPVAGEIGSSAVFLKTDVRMPAQVEGLVSLRLRGLAGSTYFTTMPSPSTLARSVRFRSRDGSARSL
jgi:NAD(P)-dependent dehydrogenase (short-subunit alcohol dehydrogenase family)